MAIHSNGVPRVLIAVHRSLRVEVLLPAEKEVEENKGRAAPRSKLVIHASARSGVVREPAAIRWESAQREPQPWWVWCRRSLQWQLIYRGAVNRQMDLKYQILFSCWIVIIRL